MREYKHKNCIFVFEWMHCWSPCFGCCGGSPSPPGKSGFEWSEWISFPLILAKVQVDLSLPHGGVSSPAFPAGMLGFCRACAWLGALLTPKPPLPAGTPWATFQCHHTQLPSDKGCKLSQLPSEKGCKINTTTSFGCTLRSKTSLSTWSREAAAGPRIRLSPDTVADLKEQRGASNPAEKADYFLFPHFPAELFIHPVFCSS